SFQLKNAPFNLKLKVEDNFMLLEGENADFIFLYNKKNEVIYVKHKKLEKTYKIAYSKISGSKFRTNLKPEKSKLTLANYKSDLYSIRFAGRDCFQVYGSKDLGTSVNSSFSSAFALYKGFVYFTGQMQAPKKCQEIVISDSLDPKVGFPLAVFYKESQVKALSVKNEDISLKQYLQEHNIKMKKAVAPSLKLQYELMLSLLSEKQQKTFNTTSKNMSIDVKIRAIDNLLKGF
ncbi:MAG TPA: hypothetical protein DCL21_04790, partial [Alphaproteobacteria bacterium]|nr:hypothetical protein [Alphaproteobacteria bacterium]